MTDFGQNGADRVIVLSFPKNLYIHIDIKMPNLKIEVCEGGKKPCHNHWHSTFQSLLKNNKAFIEDKRERGETMINASKELIELKKFIKVADVIKSIEGSRVTVSDSSLLKKLENLSLEQFLFVKYKVASPPEIEHFIEVPNNNIIAFVRDSLRENGLSYIPESE